MISKEYKTYRLGTHRTLKPATTLAQVRPFMRKMGITRIANITGLDQVGIPVYTAFRPASRSISVSQGKGIESEAAKVSAVMESVEAFHAERITQPLRYGSIDELQTEIPLADVVHIPRSTKSADGQAAPLFWIEGKNLFDQQPRWLPLETVSTDYTLPMPPGSGRFAANTNGLASGNTHVEAVCHALYEVIERDAEALWQQQPVRRQMQTGVDKSSIDDPGCQELLTKFDRAGIEIGIWDMTSDIGLPSFVCLALGDKTDWADPEFGAGCHVAREVALARALTEAAQARVTFIAGSRDDVGAMHYKPRQRRRRRRQALELMQRYHPVRDFQEVVSYNKDSVEEDLHWTLDRLSRCNIEQVIVVDLAKTEFGLQVARVVIPGLEGPYGHAQSDYTPGERAKAVARLPNGLAFKSKDLS